MQKLSSHKTIYIVQSHNEVLEAWEQHPGCNVFSLDYHTDTREAFHNYSYWRTDSEIKAGRCRDPEKRILELKEEKLSAYLDRKTNIGQINENLKHDEHLDFAVAADLVNLVFVLSTSRNENSSNGNVYLCHKGSYEGQRIMEYSPLCISSCSKKIHDDSCAVLRADHVLESPFLGEAIRRAESLSRTFFDDFILDIDCDYFNTERSLFPDNTERILMLMERARIITIALEPECVAICRCENSQLTSEVILRRLLSLAGVPRELQEFTGKSSI